MRAALPAVRFLLELAALAAAALAGVELQGVLLGVAAPLAFALAWGALVAPKARRRLPDPARLLVELALFGLVAGLLAAAGRPWPALALGLASAAVAVLMRSEAGQAAERGA